MMIADPEKMEAAKVRMRGQLRVMRYAIALFLPVAAYGIGKAAGGVTAANVQCALWTKPPPAVALRH